MHLVQQAAFKLQIFMVFDSLSFLRNLVWLA